MNTCRSCKEDVHWNYCPNCGQRAKPERIDGQYIIQEIGDFFFANKIDIIIKH
jgi:RNA polymerase subunit RPABC4/transcription elongation factor Spt4